MKRSVAFLCLLPISLWLLSIGCAHQPQVSDASKVAKADELFGQGRLEEAATLYKEITVQNPRDAHAFLRLGHIALLSKRFAAAEGDLIRAHLLQPTETEAASLLGELYQKQDALAKAAHWFRVAGNEALASKLEQSLGTSGN